MRAALVLSLVVACSSEGAGESAGEVWCKGLCASVRRCGAADADSCESSCVDRRPGLSALSVQGARALRPCLARLTCLAFDDSGAWEEETAACWDDATLRVEPIPESRAFCAEYAQDSFECHTYAGTAECERTFSMLSPYVIERLEPCLGDAACETDACIEGVIAAL